MSLLVLFCSRSEDVCVFRFSKVKAQRELARSITPGALRQCRFQNPKVARVAYVRRRWRVIRVIQHVGEGSFKAQTKPLRDLELLGQARIHINHPRTLQDAQTTIAKPARTGRRRSEGIDIEEILG